MDQIERLDELMKISGGVDTLYDDYEIGTLFMNDDKQFIRIDKNNDVFKYDKQDLKSLITGKLGKDTSGNLRQPIDMTWVAKNGAIIAYTNKDVFVMKINESSKTITAPY